MGHRPNSYAVNTVLLKDLFDVEDHETDRHISFNRVFFLELISVNLVILTSDHVSGP
jgi:hypothetical protein